MNVSQAWRSDKKMTVTIQNMIEDIHHTLFRIILQYTEEKLSNFSIFL
jgi:hypothetical protein